MTSLKSTAYSAYVTLFRTSN